MSAPHSAYWAACPDCDARVRELLAEGLTNGDAQGVAEAEHMTANACPECGRRPSAHALSCSKRPGQRALALTAVACLAVLVGHGCAILPDAIEPEVVHVSHATQHIVDHTEFGYNEVALAVKWRPTDHLTIEASEGVNLNRSWPNPYGRQYGSLIGPREVFEFRAGYEIPLRLK